MLFSGDAEDVGHLGAGVERPLRARPDGEEPVGVPLRQHRVRLEIALVDHRDAVGVLDDQVGLGESLGHVAAMEVGLLGDVDGLGGLGLALRRGDAGVGQGLAGVGLGARVRHRRRAGLHRQQRVDGDREHLVLDLDQVQRFLGDRQLVRRHGGHRLPGEDRPVDGEHGVRAGRRLLLELGDVGRRQDRPHAGQGLRPAGVDPEDPGVRVRAPQELGMQEPPRLQIRHVLDLPRDLLRPVGPGNGEADTLHITRRLHRHGDVCSSMSGCLRLGASRFVDRGQHLRVAGAPAEVAGDAVADLLLGRVRRLGEQRRGGHQDPGNAEAALGHAVPDEGVLQRVEDAVLGQPLDGEDGPIAGLERQDQAARDRLAVEMDRAGPAVAGPAPFLRPGEVRSARGARPGGSRTAGPAPPPAPRSPHSSGLASPRDGSSADRQALARASAVVSVRRVRTWTRCRRKSADPRWSLMGRAASTASAGGPLDQLGRDRVALQEPLRRRGADRRRRHRRERDPRLRADALRTA